MKKLIKAVAFGACAFGSMAAFVLLVVFIKCIVLSVPFQFSIALPPALRSSASFGIVVAVYVFIVLRSQGQERR